MGEKLTPITEMEDFTLPDEGVNVFILQNPTVIKERKDREGNVKPGWEYKVHCVQEGGGADGSIHFESFFTESKKNYSLSRLFGFLTKVGIYKPDADLDSDMFKTEGFAKKWGLLAGKKLGLEIEHQKRKDDASKTRTVARKFLTVAEAKGKGSTMVEKAEPKKEAAVEENWDE